MSAVQGSRTSPRRPRVLLVSMPDRLSGLDAVIRIPSLGIGSLAGSLRGAEVLLLDLALARGRIGPLVRSVAARFAPDFVGLSAMSFQYENAPRVARIVREALPGARTVLGGSIVGNSDAFSRYNGLMVNVRTRHLSDRALARRMVLDGLPRYFDPVVVRRNRLW